jgi:hypothetical protein
MDGAFLGMVGMGHASAEVCALPELPYADPRPDRQSGAAAALATPVSRIRPK